MYEQIIELLSNTCPSQDIYLIKNFDIETNWAQGNTQKNDIPYLIRKALVLPKNLVPKDPKGFSTRLDVNESLVIFRTPNVEITKNDEIQIGLKNWTIVEILSADNIITQLIIKNVAGDG